MERFEPIYRLNLLRRGVRASPGPPQTPRLNRTLATIEEWQTAQAEVRRLGLPPHPDGPKNWDALGALGVLLRSVPPSGCVLDAGGETYSPLVEWLYLYGYRCLEVLNLAFKRPFRRGPIRYLPGDCTRTAYPDGRFDAVACLSVLEHGVEPERFLEEARRILRPNGHLLLSTDYWPTPVDTAGRTAYGVPVKVFDRSGIERLLHLAETLGFRPTDAVDLGARDRAVRWERLDLDYTFVALHLQKVPEG